MNFFSPYRNVMLFIKSDNILPPGKSCRFISMAYKRSLGIYTFFFKLFLSCGYTFTYSLTFQEDTTKAFTILKFFEISNGKFFFFLSSHVLYNMLHISISIRGYLFINFCINICVWFLSIQFDFGVYLPFKLNQTKCVRLSLYISSMSMPLYI